MTSDANLGLSVEAIRAMNTDALQHFFSDGSAAVRRTLWAADAVLELAFKPDGTVRLEGVDAIMGLAARWMGEVTSQRYHDLVIYPTIDPDVFWVTVISEETDPGGESSLTEIVNYFRLRDGHVVHRREYVDPFAQPS